MGWRLPFVVSFYTILRAAGARLSPVAVRWAVRRTLVALIILIKERTTHGLGGIVQGWSSGLWGKVYP